jgi:hypothetical protein
MLCPVMHEKSCARFGNENSLDKVGQSFYNEISGFDALNEFAK